MASNNPSITASDIITDVEVRIGSPNLGTTVYLPWVSYAYSKTYAALYNAGRRVREQLFGAYATYTLTNGTAEYSLQTMLPRFASFIKIEILYGATGDQRVRVHPMRSVWQWDNQANVSTSYQSKAKPLYYIVGDTIGFIPTPPASDASSPTAYFWYVKRQYQITEGADVIDIPYRFLYPVVNFVQAKAIEQQNEDYSSANAVENKFERELQQIAETASGEFNENDGEAIEASSNSPIFDNPLDW